MARVKIWRTIKNMDFLKYLVGQYAIYLSLLFPVVLLVMVARRRWNSDLSNLVHSWRWAYGLLLAPTVLIWLLLAMERAKIRIFDFGDSGSGFTLLGWAWLFLLLGGILFHALALLLFTLHAWKCLQTARK